MMGFLLSLALSAGSALAFTPQEAGLSAEEWSKLLAQGQYARTVPNPGGTWPEMQIFALIHAEALEAAGIYHALDYQKDYVPHLLKSRPIKHVSPTEVLTDYEFETPWPLSNTHYVHGTKIANGAMGPRVDWYMVTSDSAEDVHGYAQFVQLDKDKTLLLYHSFVLPKSFLAGAVKKVAFLNAQESIKAIVEHVEALVKAHSPLVSKYKSYYLRALKGENVYQSVIEGNKP